jgi:hypothetical protein
MRRWFELGQLPDTTYSSNTGSVEFHQLPQKKEWIAWLNQMVGVNARLTRDGDPSLCNGVGSPHVIQSVPPCTEISAGGELRGIALFTGVPPVFQPLIRQYFEKPGVFDGPNDTQTVEKPRGSKSGKAGTQTMSLLTYLKQLLFTWQLDISPTGAPSAPQRWQEWLQTLIDHYDRYTPTQIYAFLNRVDFSAKTFKV